VTRGVLKVGLGVLVLALVAMQLVGPRPANPESNPAMRLEAQATVPADVSSTLKRACYDCHSNETKWPWYSYVAPPRWLVAHDVQEGRGHLNFSRWGEYNPFDRADMLDEACKEAKKGGMPLEPYLMLHSEAQLSPQDVEALCEWTRVEAARLTSAATP